jgi:hypothetical protein
LLPSKLVEPTKKVPLPRDERAEEELFIHEQGVDLEISTDQTVVVLKLRMADITLGAMMGLAHRDGAK